MKKRIYIFYVLLFVFLISACSKDEEDTLKSFNREQNESISLEQDDANVEVNDTNVPLPIEDKE